MPDIIDSPPALQAVPTYRVHPARAKAAFEVWQALQFTERAKPYLRENEAWKLAKQDCFNRFLFEFEAL